MSSRIKAQYLIYGFLLYILPKEVYAQDLSAANASVKIIAPIAISKTSDMYFGNITAVNGGNVILAPNGNRSKTGGVTLPSATGTVSAALFDVTGEINATYAITLPTGNYSITRVGGTQSMNINNFTSNPSVANGGSLTNGLQKLKIGARLVVPAAPVPGIYTNGAGFNITVNYN